MKQRDFAGAETAWKAFVEKHPDHDLAANGLYWLGETYYVQGNYAEAARTFLKGFQRFPDSNKAPDNLFKLGKRSEEHTSELQSLMRISYSVFCSKTHNITKINKLL